MRLSRHAILAPVPGRDQVLLVQPLTGQAALLEPGNARALEALAAGGSLPDDLPADTLREAGFVVESDDEDHAYLDAARAEWRVEAAKTPTQLVVVPSFGCNLACTYCYQELFDPAAAGLITPEAIDAFFAYVDRHHAGESPRPYLTLFGGEPLRDTPAHHDRIGRFLDGARARRMEVAVVTNGHDLAAFVPTLSSGPVKEVQVTLDGPAALHDRRRPHAGGAGTFDRIVAGIDALVAAGIPVNLRVVADRENLPALPELAAFAAATRLARPPVLPVQDPDRAQLRALRLRQPPGEGRALRPGGAVGQYVELAEAHPVLRRFHQPRFHGIGHLADAGELPAPNFDACPAAKKEWAFGPDGGVFGCTATVGHPEHRLGSFFPEAVRDEAAIARWQGRSTLSIPACDGCALAPVCGGGCGAVAWREHGTPIAPDCRPVPALYGLGARYYGLGA